MTFALARRLALHVALFLITFGIATWVQSPLYAVTIMAILLAHELGHYGFCRRYGVQATFPLFIPMPNILGTLGAVIAMKSPIPHRRALFDIGISGPLAGLALAIPAIIIGLHFSEIQPVPSDGQGLFLGEPILFTWISQQVLGTPPLGHDVYLHPIAFAGWAALFVTSINLFPIGQLDGGHIIYSLLGQQRARQISWLVVAILIYLGYHYHPMWYLFAGIIFIFIRKHPPPIDDFTPLDQKRKYLGVLIYVIMVISFCPIPFDFRLGGG